MDRLPLLLAAAMVMLTAWPCAAAEPSFPQHTLDNGRVKLRMYLPDAQRGFYRSTRFDWSGMIDRVEYAGHIFYSYWKQTHDPVNGTDDVVGPAEEFGMQLPPLGYDQARPGETFIKIGIGHLLKPQEPRYRYAQPYAIARPGAWTIISTAGFVQMQQDLKDERGYGYQYIKRIELLADAPGFVIGHRLKNTGTRPILTDHYNHNFTMIDGDRIGRNYRITLGFAPAINQVERPVLQPNVLSLEGRDVVFVSDVNQPLWVRLDGFDPASVAHNLIVIRNLRTGAAIRISGDRPLWRFAFYSADTAVCPEPFVHLDLAPGAEAQWQYRHELVAGGR